MVSFVKNIIQLVLSPTSAWEDISVSNPDPKGVAQKFMIPLFAIASLTVFVKGHYNPELSFSYLLISAAATFASLFIGYVVSEVMMKNSSYSWIEGDVDGRRCSTVDVFAFSLLAMALLVCNLLPLSLGLPYLLPLGVAMIIWKSTAYLGIKKDRELSFMKVMIITVVLVPALIRMLFDWIVA